MVFKPSEFEEYMGITQVDIFLTWFLVHIFLSVIILALIQVNLNYYYDIYVNFKMPSILGFIGVLFVIEYIGLRIYRKYESGKKSEA